MSSSSAAACFVGELRVRCQKRVRRILRQRVGVLAQHAQEQRGERAAQLVALGEARRAQRAAEEEGRLDEADELADGAQVAEAHHQVLVELY